MKKILIVGSLAYDHVMSYRGVFGKSVVPGSDSFAITTADRKLHYGGCAGNIAYSLRMLGEDPVIMTAVGRDFDDYRDRLESQGVDLSGVVVSPDRLTAMAFIVTDENQHQYTVFDPGAMFDMTLDCSLNDLKRDEIGLVIIAPDLPARMLQIALECKEASIPYFFDPGQQTANFIDTDIKEILAGCAGLVVNSYEGELICKVLNVGLEKLQTLAPIVIRTEGEKGCDIWQESEHRHVDAAKTEHAVDPTGCGDAFRAGLLAGLSRGESLVTSCRMGAVVASFNIEENGTQQHNFTREQFQNRYTQHFGNGIMAKV